MDSVVFACKYATNVVPLHGFVIFPDMEWQNIIESLLSLDRQWLLAINGWNAPWADTLMWYISKSTTWLPLYALLVWLIVWQYGVEAARCCHSRRFGVIQCLLIFAAFAVAVGGADYISSGIIKHWVCRPRPTHEPALDGMLHIVRGYTGGMYGFVSSHAANTMACALLFSLIWRRKAATLSLMVWVAMNCYSRMYLGVHYPLDILGGLIVGSLVAGGAYLGLRAVLNRVKTSCMGLETGEQSDSQAAEGSEG